MACKRWCLNERERHGGGRAGSIPVQKAEYAGFSEFRIKTNFGVR